MNNQELIKKYLLPFLIVVILVIALLLATHKSDNLTSTSTQPTVSGSRIAVTEVDKAQFPEKFPKDVPIEEGAQIVQNFNATTADGRFQATRVFKTKKSLADNLSIYRNFLTDSGFKVESTINKPNYKMVRGTKGNTALQASIDENSKSGIKTVSISYIEEEIQN